MLDYSIDRNPRKICFAGLLLLILQSCATPIDVNQLNLDSNLSLPISGRLIVYMSPQEQNKYLNFSIRGYNHKVLVGPELRTAVMKVSGRVFKESQMFDIQKEGHILLEISSDVSLSECFPSDGMGVFKTGCVQGYLKAKVIRKDGTVIGTFDGVGYGYSDFLKNPIMYQNAYVNAYTDVMRKLLNDKEFLGMIGRGLGDLVNLTDARTPEEQKTLPKPEVKTQPPAPSSPQQEKLKSSGTGFFINDKGHLLTNYHVIKQCSGYAIEEQGKKIFLDLVSTDPVNDLAILKSNIPSINFAKFSGRNRLKRGDDITVIGYPLRGLLSSDAIATFGNINALRGMQDDSSRIQISAPIQAGNSGGPVLDEYGNVVAVIVSSIYDKYLYEKTGSVPQNANFAVNGLFVRTFLDGREIKYEISQSTDQKISKTAVVDRGVSFTRQVLCFD